MECLSPKFIGYYCGRDNVTLKCNIIKPKKGIDPTSLLLLHPEYIDFFVPCGKCSLCLCRKKQDMTTRIIHETKLYDISSFLTLTYSPENLPFNNNHPTLVKKDLQDFLKRLRYYTGIRFRYFAVGEYGSKGRRPHYHIIIFGWFPSDGYIFQYRQKYNIYRSPLLEKAWTKGFSTVGVVNTSVAKYCAQYVAKKNNAYIPPSGVEEFFLASKMQGGIGAKFLDSNVEDISTLNSCLMRNSNGSLYKVPIPAYYLNRIKQLYPFAYRKLISIWEKSNYTPKTYSDLVAKAKNINKTNNKIEQNKELHNEKNNRCSI